MKRLALILAFFALPAWPQTAPTNGALATSAGNTTRPVILPDHWTLAQTKNMWTLGPTGLVGNGTSCTATVPTDPTAGSPRIRVGGSVTTAGMTNAAGDQTKKLVTAVDATTITFACDFNGTTGNGIISADIWPEPAIGASFTQPNTTFANVVEVKLIDESGVASAILCRPLYRDVPLFNITQEYGMVFCGGRGIVIINKATNAASCNGVIGSEDLKPRWTRDEADPYKVYYVSNATIREMNIIGCGTSLVKDFSATYSRISFSSGGRVELDGTGDEIIGVVGCFTGTSCPNNTSIMDTFPYNLTDLTSSAIYTVPAGREIDEMHVWAGSGKRLINYMANGTGENQGIALIDASGVFEKKLDSVNRHLNIGVRSGADVWMYNDSTNGVTIQDTATQTDTVFFAKTNANAAGTGSCSGMGFQIAIEGAWVGLAITQEPVALPESAIGSSWDTNWCRGANEQWVCKITGTLDGTNNCRRMGHRWTSQAAIAPSSGSIYNRSPFPALSMLTVAQAAAGDVPTLFSYNADFRLATNNSTTSLVMSTMYFEITTAAGGLTLTSIAPDTGVQNTVVPVTLTGTGMGGANPSITVSETGVTVSSLVVNGATEWTADFTVDVAAATTTRTVQACTDDGCSNDVNFSVTAAAAPTLSGVSPASCVEGRAPVTAVLTGTNFDPAMTVGVSGSGVTTELFYQSPTSASVIFTCALGAAASVRTVSVTTGAGTSGTQNFTVVAKPVSGVGIPTDLRRE